MNLGTAIFNLPFNHSVVAVTETFSFTGFHPALITLNHYMVYGNTSIWKNLMDISTLNSHEI
ncbi:MAG: hypothetical protein JXB00_09325 [Bacteroidales bacterium]|nr:hypothetical protein [Bacteroidales bacterium]